MPLCSDSPVKIAVDRRLLVFAERMLPSTQTYIPAQIHQLRGFAPTYVGLLPADTNFDLGSEPVLLRSNRSAFSKLAREWYRWTGLAPRYHARLKTIDADLIHAHFSEGGSAALFLSRKLNLPLLLNLHGGAELMTDVALTKKWFEWPFLAHRVSLWRRSSGFLCASGYIRARALEAGFPAGKLHIQYAGLDCTTFTPKRPPENKERGLVVFVGRLTAYKGCDYLLHAMQVVQRDRPNARLVVIGDGGCRKGLTKLAKTLSVDCHFTGELNQKAVVSWLEKARVFCVPSHTLADGQGEAFGIVFLEAQAMGVPVVSFRHGGIPETMREGVTGLLAKEGDVRELAGHIMRYLYDDAFWRRSRDEGMRWVRDNFDRTIQTSKLEDYYYRAISSFRSDQFEQRM